MSRDNQFEVDQFIAQNMTNQKGQLASRDLGDGREVALVPLLEGRTRLVIGTIGDFGYDDGW